MSQALPLDNALKALRRDPTHPVRAREVRASLTENMPAAFRRAEEQV